VWTNYVQFWDDFVDPLKATFNGDTKIITISPQYFDIRVKQDLYSASKRWLQRRQNAGYLPCFETSGGESVGNGLYTGDIYFLVNGWKISVNHQVNITGTVYNKTNPLQSPYIVGAGGGIIATVSSLAYAYNTTGVTVPSAAENANAVWNSNPSSYATNTVGGKIQQIDQNTTNIKTTTDNIFAVTV
jgi:hypothetical protein